MSKRVKHMHQIGSLSEWVSVFVSVSVGVQVMFSLQGE